MTRARAKSTPPVFGRPLTLGERQARWRAARAAERETMVTALKAIAHTATTIKTAREIAEWALLDRTE